jgi:hypothetical protein
MSWPCPWRKILDQPTRARHFPALYAESNYRVFYRILADLFFKTGNILFRQFGLLLGRCYQL